MAEAGGHERAASLRQALVDYVRELHRSYVSAARRGGADPAALPLGHAAFTVAVVAANELHLLATRDQLPAVRAHERPVDDAAEPLRWQVRFLDVTVLPDLAEATSEHVTGADVQRLLGVTEPLYHLVVNPAGSLSGHQAMHAGTGLADAHVRGQA